jgi:hypothetical protein
MKIKKYFYPSEIPPVQGLISSGEGFGISVRLLIMKQSEGLKTCIDN